ncbi:Alpha/beta hydrolase [Caballeronia temeraria]|uniref:Alpha/beta hydrolase n=1 Tax=Caballeronia temeraria TaxID=1777137 RepID=A0A158DLE3_9BURK|nr:Alpha/beta hydrolase [Caballeronia temeraria]
MPTIAHRHIDVDGFNVFYREAGPADAPKLLLLHGFPSSSHMFRDLIPLLADRFHIVAPDLPGFGLSDMPSRDSFAYTFDNIAGLIDRFTERVGFDRYAVYVFDYGAPTGFRLALKHPERIAAIVSQNGNAYEEGLSDGWSPIRAYWQPPTQTNRDALRDAHEGHDEVAIHARHARRVGGFARWLLARRLLPEPSRRARSRSAGSRRQGKNRQKAR